MRLINNFLSASAPVLNSSISYATASVSRLVNEGYAKVQSTFGGTGGLTGLSANLPSFEAVGMADPTDTITTPASAINAAIEADSGSNTSHKVRLIASTADGESMAIQNDVNFPVEALMERMVEFDVMPEVSEVRNAEYEALSPAHMPGEFQKYKGTKSTQWVITGTFTARTREEAMRNYIYMNNLRGWTMPYFGTKQATQFGDGGSRGKLGAPPPVLRFSGWRGLVGTVPVVITSLNWSWPKDVDWIPTGIKDHEGQEIPFPTVMQVNINIVESFSAHEFNGFDLVAFRNGRMVNAWKPLNQTESDVSSAEAIGGQQGISNGTPTPTDNDEHSQTITEMRESAATPTANQNISPAPGQAQAKATYSERRLSEIAKEISSLEAARNEYHQILTNPSTPVQTKTIMATASVSASTKITALQLERSKLDLIK